MVVFNMYSPLGSIVTYVKNFDSITLCIVVACSESMIEHDRKVWLGSTVLSYVIPYSFWTGLYCRHSLKHQVCELKDEVVASMQQQNFCLTEHIKFLQQVGVYWFLFSYIIAPCSEKYCSFLVINALV